VSTLRRSLVALAAILAIPATGHAQQADAWKWQAAIYGYFPDLGGTSTFPQAAAGSDVTIDSSKIIDALKFTFMGSLEASNGRWGMLTDVIYMDLGGSKSGTRDFTLGGLPLPGGAAANAHYDLKGWAWTLAGTWRLSSDPASPADLIAGARMLDIQQTLRWEITGNTGIIPLPGRTGEAKTDLNNWDAIVGVKGRFALGGGKWFVPYYADIGTGESKLTWQAMAGLGYSFGWGDIVAAWRYIDYDMKSGKNIESLTFNGPAIAAVFRW
jgi:hypothetical protein